MSGWKTGETADLFDPLTGRYVGTTNLNGSEQLVPTATTDSSGNVTGLSVGGGIVVGGAYLPSGGDDTAGFQAYANAAAAIGQTVRLGSGNFIFTGPITLRSSMIIDKWGNKGIGLKVLGNGPGNTKIYYSGSSASPMFNINSPTAVGIGNRNYFTEIEGFSALRATSGTTQISQASTSGMAIMGAPLSATGEVLHTSRLRNLFIDGFDYPVTLSDSTLMELDTVWINEFLVGVRLGYNVDICKIRHCMFGSEQFAASYRNSAIAVQDGYSDGFNTAGGENIVEFDHCWFMKIGKGFECQTTNLAGLRFMNSYFEDTQRYFHHKDNAAGYSVVSFEKCHFSHPSTNDTNQSDPTLANYQAKIQFDGDVTTGVGKNVLLSMRDNTADILAPTNAWVSFVNVDSYTSWDNNATLAPSATYGHIRCARTARAAQRTFPLTSGLYPGSWVMSDKAGAGLAIQSGTAIEVSQTIAASGTYNINHYNGTHFYLTLPDGDCTIQIDAPSAGYYPTQQSKVKVILIAPASVTALRTITFGSRLTGAGATLTYTTTDNNKRAILMLEGTGKGDVSMRATIGAPTFI